MSDFPALFIMGPGITMIRDITVRGITQPATIGDLMGMSITGSPIGTTGIGDIIAGTGIKRFEGTASKAETASLVTRSRGRMC